MEDEETREEADALARSDGVVVSLQHYEHAAPDLQSPETHLSDDHGGPDHVGQPKLRGGQADDLSKNVQPPYHPADDSSLLAWDQLRRRGVPERVRVISASAHDPMG